MSRTRPLKLREVKKILKHYKFAHKRTKGSHEQHEGHVAGVRQVVTVDSAIDEFCKKLLKTMIEQSGLTKKDWYAVVGIKF